MVGVTWSIFVANKEAAKYMKPYNSQDSTLRNTLTTHPFSQAIFDTLSRWEMTRKKKSSFQELNPCRFKTDVNRAMVGIDDCQGNWSVFFKRWVLRQTDSAWLEYPIWKIFLFSVVWIVHPRLLPVQVIFLFNVWNALHIMVSKGTKLLKQKLVLQNIPSTNGEVKVLGWQEFQSPTMLFFMFLFWDS